MEAKVLRRWAKRLTVVVSLTLLIAVAVVLLRRPSLDRRWAEDVSVLAEVVHAGAQAVTLRGIRDWRYTETDVTDRSYFEQTYNPEAIVDVWFYEQLLDDSGSIAHTFVVFEFGDVDGPRRSLGLSVETRREAGEEYSILGGVLRKFEITHTWATERDLVSRRVIHLDYPLTRYRLEIPEAYRARIFRQFVDETTELARRPRWYNTVTDNCTSSLIEYVNAASPGAIPWDSSHVFTGRLDDYLATLGFLDRAGAQLLTRETLADD